MPHILIDESSVGALVAAEKDCFWRDTELKGFSVKVTPKGQKSYVIDYRLPGSRQSLRYTIGRHGSPWTAELARKEAAKRLLEASQGIDPNAEKRRGRGQRIDYAFDAYADRFVEQYLREKWPGSSDRAESILRCHAKPHFGRCDIRDITKQDCSAFIDNLSSKNATARKAGEVVGKMFRWAEDRGDIERSPMERVALPSPNIGDLFVLSDDELRLIWKAAATMDHPYGNMVRVMMLAGQKRRDIRELRWDEVDHVSNLLDVPVGRAKRTRTHAIPMTPMMADAIEELPRTGPFVFSVTGEKPVSNLSQLKSRLNARMERLVGGPVRSWTLRDLQRTMAAGLQRLGIPSDMVAMVQGSLGQLGTGPGYRKYDYIEARREALEKWDAHIAGLLNDTTNLRAQNPWHESGRPQSAE